jgi:hypothetical protein
MESMSQNSENNSGHPFRKNLLLNKIGGKSSLLLALGFVILTYSLYSLRDNAVSNREVTVKPATTQLEYVSASEPFNVDLKLVNRSWRPARIVDLSPSCGCMQILSEDDAEFEFPRILKPRSSVAFRAKIYLLQSEHARREFFVVVQYQVDDELRRPAYAKIVCEAKEEDSPAVNK